MIKREFLQELNESGANCRRFDPVVLCLAHYSSCNTVPFFKGSKTAYWNKRGHHHRTCLCGHVVPHKPLPQDSVFTLVSEAPVPPTTRYVR